MSLPHDLLEQAVLLAAIDSRRPKQANLRRSISAAYYALFHLLVEEAVALLCPARPAGLAPRFGRAFNHADMKHVCKSISDSHPPAILLKLIPPPGFSVALRLMAVAFVDLQVNRHAADYDTAVAYSRAECEALIDRARDAFSAWNDVRGSDEAAVFLSALLLHKQWSR